MPAAAAAGRARLLWIYKIARVQVLLHLSAPMALPDLGAPIHLQACLKMPCC